MGAVVQFLHGATQVKLLFIFIGNCRVAALVQNNNLGNNGGNFQSVVFHPYLFVVWRQRPLRPLKLWPLYLLCQFMFYC